MTDENKAKPDVEEIIQSIQKDLGPELGTDAAEPETAVAEDDLHANLDAANRTCRVGVDLPGGLRGVVARCACIMLRPVLSEINSFNARVVRVLNKTIAALEGEDSGLEGELLTEINRRTSLLSGLTRRLDAYDEMRIEKRLEELEKRAASDVEGPDS